MGVLLTYVLLGLSLAAPIGPVNAAQLDRGIKNGFIHSWLVGLGATAADGIYMLLVFLGVVHLLGLPFVQVFLWLFGAFVLLYTGIEAILGARDIRTESLNRAGPTQTYIKSFTSGFLMSLFNPLTILFWLGIFGSVLAKTVTNYGTSEVILYVAAIFFGIAIWDVTMAFFSSTMKNMLTSRVLYAISVLSALSLLGFGAYFAWQAFSVLFS
ncbi:LysE family transporter [Alteribacter natronophilus]|uniref:LysE family transporter n=1 Tax=Alteribacter natronophilus TaxID=2583810 RepID=UPI00110E2AA1|nr:LysE family transporter [Alteribacter natronophilus]TMW72915.1 amino acid transporter [Alteribacter natronophilus]